MVARYLPAFCFYAYATLAAQGLSADLLTSDFESFDLGPLADQGEWAGDEYVSIVKPGLDYIGPFGGFKEGGSKSLQLATAASETAETQATLPGLADTSILSMVLRAVDGSPYVTFHFGPDGGLSLALDFAREKAVINGAEVELSGIASPTAHQLVLAFESEAGVISSASLWLDPSEVEGNLPIALVEGLSVPQASDGQLRLTTTGGTVRIDTIETASDFTALVPSASAPGKLVINGSLVTEGITTFTADNGVVTVDHAADNYAGNDTVQIEAIANPNYVFRYLEVIRNGRSQIYYDSIVRLAVNGDAEIQAEFGVIHKDASFEATANLAAPDESSTSNGLSLEHFNSLLAAAYKIDAGGATGFDQPLLGDPVTQNPDSDSEVVPSGNAVDLNLKLSDKRTLRIVNGPRTVLTTVDASGHPNLDHRQAFRWDGAIRFPLKSETNTLATDGVVLGGATSYELVFDPADEITAVGVVVLLELTGMGAAIEGEEPLLVVSAQLSDGASHIDLEFDPEDLSGLHHQFYGFEATDGLFITSLTLTVECGEVAPPRVAIDSLGVVTHHQEGIKIETQSDGEGEVTGGGEYASGSQVILGAKAAPGNVFLSWSESVEQGNPLILTPGESTTVTAKFGPAPQAGGSFTTAFQSEGDALWSASSDADWLEGSVSSKDGFAVLDLKFAPNNEADARSANVELVQGEEVINHAVVQKGRAHELLGEEIETVGPGWVGTLYQTNWIGEIEVAVQADQTFLRTEAHGWWYVLDDHDALWAFDFDGDQWMWLSPASWPTVYNSSAGWMTWSGTTFPRWFFSYLLNDWITLEQI